MRLGVIAALVIVAYGSSAASIGAQTMPPPPPPPPLLPAPMPMPPPPPPVVVTPPVEPSGSGVPDAECTQRTPLPRPSGAPSAPTSGATTQRDEPKAPCPTCPPPC